MLELCFAKRSIFELFLGLITPKTFWSIEPCTALLLSPKADKVTKNHHISSSVVVNSRDSTLNFAVSPGALTLKCKFSGTISRGLRRADLALMTPAVEGQTYMP